MLANMPHRTFEGTPQLEVTNLSIDGVKRMQYVEPHLQRIDLAEAGDWEEMELSVKVRAPLEDVVAFIEDGDGRPEAVLVLYCSTTNVRYGQRAALAGDEEDEAEFHLSVPLQDLDGKVELYIHLTNDFGDGVPRRVKTSNTWALYVDAVARPPFEGTFAVRWSYFQGPEREPTIPEHAAGETFYVDLTPSTPLVHLSKDDAAYVELLEGDDGASPLGQQLREAELRRVAAATWTSAIGASIASIQVDDMTGAHELPTTPWKADVLKWALPQVYPKLGQDEALKAARKGVLEGDGMSHALIQLAVSKHLGAGRAIKQALKSVAG